MTSRISIAMATYNGAKYLQKQLDSFLYQTRLPDELVVCDDGSTDVTLEILEDFRRQVSFDVRVYRNEVNLGYTKNFEKSLSLCTGDIIFLSDQDDVWYAEKISTMVNWLRDNPKCFVLQTNMALGDEKAIPTKFTQLGNILALGHSINDYFSGCATAVRKVWLDVIFPIPAEVTGHDNWLHRLAIAMKVRGLHQEPLQCYRRHETNASNGLASKPTSISALDSFRAHGLRNATSAWSDELHRVRLTRDRLCARSDAFETMGLFARLPQAILNLEQHAHALEARIRNSNRPRLLRVPHLIALWLNGGYRYFAGWKSLAKDMLRP